MPQGSLRRFPFGAVTLAFLVGTLLAGMLNLPGFSVAQQQQNTRLASDKAPAPAATGDLQ